MTFVYRQLATLSTQYRLILLTSTLENTELYPFSPIYLKSKSLIDRLYHRAYKQITRHYIGLGFLQKLYWQRILRKHEIKLIHAHFGVGGIEILALSQKLQIPLLVSFHGYDASRLLSNKRYVTDLEQLFRTSHNIVVSKKMRETLLSLGAHPGSTTLLPYGIPLKDFPPVERRPLRQKIKAGEQITFLQVSNFVEKKGHYYTLQAFKIFLQYYESCQLILAGDGEQRAKMEKLAQSLGINEQVHFLGAVTQSQVKALLSQADVFVHHSVTASDGDQEGTPPVISTYHAGIPDVIQDGVNGYLVEERDVATYAQKMRAVLNDDGTLREHAVHTIRTSYNLVTQNKKLSRIYEELIKKEC